MATSQRPCEREWSQTKAEGMQRLMVELTGGCPCLSGNLCPLIPPEAQQSAAA